MSFTVTATGSSGTNSIALQVVVLDGASGTIGRVANAAGSGIISLAISPLASGSYVYGAQSNINSAAYTALASTTYDANLVTYGSFGLNSPFGAFHSSAATTGGTPVTLGSSTGANIAVIALAEIEGSGITEDASTPVVVTASTTTATTASFTPPGGSLLVAMIAADKGFGNITVAVTDTSGLSLTWTQQSSTPASNFYAGVWTAPVPMPDVATASAALGALAESGTGMVLNPFITGEVVQPGTGAGDITYYEPSLPGAVT